MKRFSTRIALFALATILSVNSYGQAAKENGFTKKNGKMMMITNGELSELKKDFVSSTGHMFKTDGTVVSNTGTSVVLKDGEKVDFQGKPLTQQPARQTTTPAGKH